MPRDRGWWVRSWTADTLAAEHTAGHRLRLRLGHSGLVWRDVGDGTVTWVSDGRAVINSRPIRSQADAERLLGRALAAMRSEAASFLANPPEMAFRGPLASAGGRGAMGLPAAQALALSPEHLAALARGAGLMTGALQRMGAQPAAEHGLPVADPVIPAAHRAPSPRPATTLPPTDINAAYRFQP